MFSLSRYNHSDTEKNRSQVVQLPGVIWGKSHLIAKQAIGLFFHAFSNTWKTIIGTNNHFCINVPRVAQIKVQLFDYL
jgi:hypothetical protein